MEVGAPEWEAPPVGVGKGGTALLGPAGPGLGAWGGGWDDWGAAVGVGGRVLARFARVRDPPSPAGVAKARNGLLSSWLSRRARLGE